MDINYLLWLQNFRNSINDAWTPFMEWVSMFSTTYLILIPVFLYWNWDKRKSLYTLVSYYLCCGFNAIVKLTVCAYRPWIRDARVHPAGDAITTATGYSFPSGHTVTAGPIYGGLAVVSWSWKKFVSVILGIFLLLTAFSRNYLGVHTPQDVFVGICESVFWLIIVAKIFTYLDEHPEKENLLLLICFIVGWLGIAYITFKPYPMDYVDGKLLVDPQKMMNDGYGDICLLISLRIRHISFPLSIYVCFIFESVKNAEAHGFQLLDAPVTVGIFVVAGDVRNTYRASSCEPGVRQQPQVADDPAVVPSRILPVDVRIHVLDVYEPLIYDGHQFPDIIFRNVEGSLHIEFPFIAA